MARLRTIGVTALVVAALFGALAPRGAAQEGPTLTLPTFTTTTTVPTPTTGPTSTEPPTSDTTVPSETSTTVDPSGDAEGGSAVGGAPGQAVPADAQAVIDS